MFTSDIQQQGRTFSNWLLLPHLRCCILLPSTHIQFLRTREIVFWLVDRDAGDVSCDYAQRPHLRLVWSAAENQSDNMRLLCIYYKAIC